MRVRSDRLAVIRDAGTTLAACVICFRILVNDTLSFERLWSVPFRTSA